MLEHFISYICENAHHAHWVIFLLLLLSGLNIPISEEFLLLAGGVIAATCIPDHTFNLYLWVFMGCYVSAWEAYWIGRLLGPKLYQFRLFQKIMTPQRLNLLRHYYAKFGIFTFIAGRFCPGGVRNALFISSGLTKMPFPLFMMRDGIACLISSAVFFSLGYHFAANIELISFYLREYTLVALSLVIMLIGAGVSLYLWQSRKG